MSCWPVPFDAMRIDLHVEGRITPEDAARQASTAAEILRRLRRQPGVVLADEVGMGKTFVALAVAASVAWADRERRPVLVMVPSALRDKWPRDLQTFRTRCVRETPRSRPLTGKLAANAVDLFRLLDDPPATRPQLIFVPHGAFHHSLRDPWLKLAILKRAFRAPRLARQRESLPRFAANVLRKLGLRLPEEVFARLLRSPYERWRTILQRAGQDPGDDPIPLAIGRVLKSERLGFRALRDQLERFPLRSSAYVEDRLARTRQALNQSIRELWPRAVKRARFRSPLLILDEAHHLKNPATRLASLFVERDSVSDEERSLMDGLLENRFERMLFLTATPFQLGHHELLNVLDRFRGVAWPHSRRRAEHADFKEKQTALRKALDRAQEAATHLDSQWKHLGELPEGVEVGPGLDAWWERLTATREDQPERTQSVLRAYHRCQERMREAEAQLRPWVIRHHRSRQLPESDRARRLVLSGDAIASRGGRNGQGLAIGDGALLPFLLAARAEVLEARLARQTHGGRPVLTFAEGLASSFEAFRETRRAREARSDREIADEYEVPEERLNGSRSELTWYIRKLAAALRSERETAPHPKVSATVEKALDLWRAGEKVLIFCHYRATGEALRRRILDALEEEIPRLAAQRMRASAGQARRRLESIDNRFDKDGSLNAKLTQWVERTLRGRALADGERDTILRVIRRYVRTPGFLARYFPLRHQSIPGAFSRSLQAADASGLSLRKKLDAFVAFLVEQCHAEEREEYLEALKKLRPTPVRLINGATKRDDRREILLGFNTPFFPEILVASSVMAEGVDLHRDCRYVIHHDLSWNPSTLEQRTGRVDRIGAKAEIIKEPIHVFLPYVGGTQDEKIYRVVRDRERWFQVVMGEEYALEQSEIDELGRRLPLPETAGRKLGLRLQIEPGASVPPDQSRVAPPGAP